MMRHYQQVPSNYRSGVRVLDLGCGQGATTWFLSREGFTVIPVDGSQSALAKMTKRLREEGIEVQPYCCDIAQLPFPDNFFDVVIDVVSIAHNTNYEDIFKEVSRVLKPGGRFFSMTPRVDCTIEPFEDKGPVSFLSLNALNKCLKDKFKSTIGWVEINTTGQEGRTLRHWVVDALRVDYGPIRAKVPMAST